MFFFLRVVHTESAACWTCCCCCCLGTWLVRYGHSLCDLKFTSGIKAGCNCETTVLLNEIRPEVQDQRRGMILVTSSAIWHTLYSSWSALVVSACRPSKENSYIFFRFPFGNVTCTCWGHDERVHFASADSSGPQGPKSERRGF